MVLGGEVLLDVVSEVEVAKADVLAELEVESVIRLLL
jgi:hypothetical protein